jgi:GxxExxY protein
MQSFFICREIPANKNHQSAKGGQSYFEGIDQMDINDLTGRIIGAAIEVHKALGPGLLESAYEECLCIELGLRKMPNERQKELPVEYKGVKLDCGYRLDIVVANRVIVELKACESLLPIHEAQLLTYLKLSGIKVGLLINFNVPILKEGIRRLAN